MGDTTEVKYRRDSSCSFDAGYHKEVGRLGRAHVGREIMRKAANRQFFSFLIIKMRNFTPKHPIFALKINKNLQMSVFFTNFAQNCAQ